jgi:hypothetical protein
MKPKFFVANAAAQSLFASVNLKLAKKKMIGRKSKSSFMRDARRVRRKDLRL